MTIRARKPAASARSTSERVIAGSACVYSWNQRVPPGAPAATASIEWDDVVDSVYGIPAAAAPRAASISPSGWASVWNAIGAIAIGRALGWPMNVDRGSTRETSTRTRGRNRRRRHAATLSWRLSSSQAPPAT